MLSFQCVRLGCFARSRWSHKDVEGVLFSRWLATCCGNTGCRELTILFKRATVPTRGGRKCVQPEKSLSVCRLCLISYLGALCVVDKWLLMPFKCDPKRSWTSIPMCVGSSCLTTCGNAWITAMDAKGHLVYITARPVSITKLYYLSLLTHYKVFPACCSKPSSETRR